MAAAALAVLETLVAVELARGQFEALVAGAGWPTMLFALPDDVIAVAWTPWFIAWLRSRWSTHGPRLGEPQRSSLATYFSHPLVLTAVMVAFASVTLAPEIKFVLVAAAGVPACLIAGYAPTCRAGPSDDSDRANWTRTTSRDEVRLPADRLRPGGPPHRKH